MRTFCIATLGCKVNQYESEQIAALLRGRGLVQVDRAEQADLRIVNTCSVTVQAASKSRQAVRQVVRLPVLHGSDDFDAAGERKLPSNKRQRTIVTGCWATSDASRAGELSGVCAVIGHHDDVADRLQHLISIWHDEDSKPPAKAVEPDPTSGEPMPKRAGDNGWINQATAQTSQPSNSKSQGVAEVKRKVARKTIFGTTALPLLDCRQTTHQRAFLKIQDGCDAHCTYCIIPKLRPGLWSKPVEDVIAEARRLVDAGHRELVLTGIFLGAYGQPTALRRRQCNPGGGALARLINALCERVTGLERLRLSSLEPGDLTDDLLSSLASHPQTVPHFHLPLQSGSDRLLRRMNRQYGRDEYLRMIEKVRQTFDRPAITTDIIVGFPGETDEEFTRTVDAARQAGFIHIHAFSFSVRPGTAAARWQKDFVRGPIVNERINLLEEIAAEQSLEFRRQFVGQTVELLVERPGARDADTPQVQHGRCERYFSVHFEHADPLVGQSVRVRIQRVTAARTFGRIVASCQLPVISDNQPLATGNSQLATTAS